MDLENKKENIKFHSNTIIGSTDCLPIQYNSTAIELYLITIHFDLANPEIWISEYRNIGILKKNIILKYWNNEILEN